MDAEKLKKKKTESETVPGESGGKVPGKCGFSLIQKCKHRKKCLVEEQEDKKENNNNQNRVKNHAPCQPNPRPHTPLLQGK